MKTVAGIVAALSFLTCDISTANPVTLFGKVVDSVGQPINHATVLIYHAGVKKGYSTFCPSCYVDCGKKATTGQDGSFAIKGVDSQLLFELLAVRDGFQPVFVKKVDPLSRPTPIAVLVARQPGTISDQVVRGRVVDDHGLTLRDAVVQPVAVSSNESLDGKPGKSEVTEYGTPKWLEPIAITDQHGDFEIAGQKPALAMLLKFETRGFAPKLETLQTGMDRQTVVVMRGAAIRGRLIDHGTPVSGAEIGLMPRNRGGVGGKLKVVGDLYDEIRVGTQADGSFVLADVPAPIGWYVYPKMESLPKTVAAEPLECNSERAGEVVDIGDIQLSPGHRLRGKVVLSDRASIADGMRITIDANHAFDSQVANLHADGSFEFDGLPTGSYGIFASVRGYEPTEQLRNMQINRDIDEMIIALKPKT